jgi:RimJ/RimL family protein N-acetyltransferase
MIARMPVTETTTQRLALSVPAPADVAELHEMYADRRVWRDDPITRHVAIEQTEGMVEHWRAGWRRNGFGFWMARGTQQGNAGEFVGIGGCSLRYGVAWNLGYRLSPLFWGQGYAQEINTAALAAARRLRPDLPMTAYLLEGNVRSQRTTERAGLHLIWRGPDAGNPDPSAVRLLYADSDLSPDVIDRLTAE